MSVIQLSKDQSSAFNDITDWYVYHQNSVPFLTMGGYAGTGKTTMMSMLQDRLNNSTIAYCAYTGKAANVLRKKLNEHNQNIERTGSVMEKSYKEFMEAKVKSWKDMKDRNVIRAADKFKKKMRKGNVLGYTLTHNEFTIFRTEKEWEDSVKYAKDMKWIKVD